MGDSACVVEGHGLDKLDIAAALRESVSFGRFMTEQLEWGKWSSFSQNKYIEEAEKYSTRGSVAQKKAYFEEHYKRIAAKKAAEQLEQENAANSCTLTEEECEKSREQTTEFANCNGHPVNNSHHLIYDGVSTFSDADKSVSHGVEANDGANLTGLSSRQDDIDTENDTDTNECGPHLKREDADNGTQESEAIQVMEQARIVVSEEPCLESNYEKIEMKQNNENQLQKPPPLKENNASNRSGSCPNDPKSKTSMIKQSLVRKTITFQPSLPLHPRKENNPNLDLLGKKTAKISNDRKHPFESSFQVSDHSLTHHKGGLTSEGPAPKMCKVSESRINFGCFKAFQQDYSNSRKTPTKESAKSEPKTVPVTPRSENRSKTSSDKSESRTKKSNTKWNSLLNRGKTSCIGNSNSCNPQVVKTFFFRSEERAEKRKEYFMKLEEKLNAEKLERQAKAKEKAENDLKLLRQNLGFKARPLPKFYKRNETSKQEDATKSNPVTKPELVKIRSRTGGVHIG